MTNTMQTIAPSPTSWCPQGQPPCCRKRSAAARRIVELLALVTKALGSVKDYLETERRRGSEVAFRKFQMWLPEKNMHRVTVQLW